MAKITINDVAKHAGVSITTVSRVLNNRGYISDATREKVQASINELGFIPNELARSFFTCSSNLIGLIIPTTANPFFGELTFYIEKQLSKEGYKLFICNSINENENEKEYLRMLQENRVDGIIVGSHNLNIAEYDKLPLKAVSVERVLNDSIPVIQCDNYQGGRIATQTLIHAGCRKILCLSGDFKLNAPANSRYTAHKDCMAEHGLPYHIESIPFTVSNEEKIARITEIMDSCTDIDGVFAGDDILASIVYNYAVQHRITVPERLKIIGFDGTEAIHTIFPALTTIQQPIEFLAEKSVRLLLSLIREEHVPPVTTLPVDLYRGGTV
ncbi:LacI family DNA-binding transcriptional regulator [Hungatella hathewayi]|uniref:LacI family DNA-binding transcriptional regulator n=1 Tax=Hungatella hathewayi TaxID=154046 RepID=UPI00210F138B|nr:LacI family DNA-binding transcriptional regulator [Hungatella hathewayi]MCQ5386283.1 LacI family DNA-binding transcriptional regulator [Hungatella hathewayi]